MLSYYIGLEQARRKQGQHLSRQKGKRTHKSKNTIRLSELTRGINKDYDTEDTGIAEFVKRVFKKKEDK